MRAEPTSHGFGIMNAPGPSWSWRKRVALSSCVTLMQPISDQNLPSRIADRKHACSATRPAEPLEQTNFHRFRKSVCDGAPHKRTAALGRGMCYPQLGTHPVAYVCSVPNKPSHNAFIQV